MLSENRCRSMSEPARMWPVSTLPISRGRKRASSRIRRSASSRMSRRFGVRASPFVQAGERLDLVADFGVARQIGRLDPALADAVGGLLLGPVVLRLLPGVHQPGGFPGDLPPQFRLVHARRRKPRCAARGRRLAKNKFGSRTAAESRTAYYYSTSPVARGESASDSNCKLQSRNCKFQIEGGIPVNLHFAIFNDQFAILPS